MSSSVILWNKSVLYKFNFHLHKEFKQRDIYILMMTEPKEGTI